MPVAHDKSVETEIDNNLSNVNYDKLINFNRNGLKFGQFIFELL